MGSFYLFGQPSTRVEVAAIVLFPLLLSWLVIDDDLDTLHLSHDQQSWRHVDGVLGDM